MFGQELFSCKKIIFLLGKRGDIFRFVNPHTKNFGVGVNIERQIGGAGIPNNRSNYIFNICPLNLL